MLKQLNAPPLTLILTSSSFLTSNVILSFFHFFLLFRAIPLHFSPCSTFLASELLTHFQENANHSLRSNSGSRCSDIGSKTGVFLMVLSILCGLCSFILSLIAEAMRSEATWVLSSADGGGDQRYECIYNSSGKIPLLCAAGAFLSLAIAMVMEHAYMLVAVSRPTPPALIAWNPDESPSAKYLTWQAALFFFSTWICFAAGEMLLMIGIGVESGHLRKWARPRASCLVARQGIFLAAGIFALSTVFLASGLYLTALRAQRLSQEQDEARREAWDSSMLYASPPRSPRRLNTIGTMIENTRLIRQEQVFHTHDEPLRPRDPFFSIHKSMSSTMGII